MRLPSRPTRPDPTQVRATALPRPPRPEALGTAARPPPNRAPRWLPVALFVLFAALAAPWFVPGLPYGYALDVEFAEAPAGTSEPLLVAGETGAGDFLFVRHIAPTRVVLGYERWGSEARLSAPFDITPGERRRLEVSVPAFSRVRGGTRGGDDQVQVRLDGDTLLDFPTRFTLRKGSRLFFGENPLGGGTCGPEFRGVLWHPDGHELRGNARRVFTVSERLRGWIVDGWPHLAFLLLASLAAAAVWRWSRSGRATAVLTSWIRTARAHLPFALTAAAALVAFATVITGGTGRLWFPESFGDFFDYQALALLHGRLDVPEAAISGEAFLVDGRTYGYFGLTPALVRLPFALFDLAPGWWSRSVMCGWFVVGLVAAYSLLVQIYHAAAGATRRVPGWMAVLFTLNVGLGSTLFFLSSRAYIYHETTLTGAALALVSAALALRYFLAPRPGWWVGAFAAALCSLHARPPTGLFALVLLSLFSLAVIGRRIWATRSLDGAWRPAVVLPLLCLGGVFTFNGVSFLKFGTFDGAPLRFHVQYHPGRLANIEGKNFHASNLPYNVHIYLWGPNFVVRPTFPWFYITGRDPNQFPGSRIDLAEPTVALPYAMPGLTFLAIAAAAVAAIRRPDLRLGLAASALAVLPMAAAMFTAVAVSQRYTTDFVPWLVLLAAYGIVGLGLLGAGRRVAVLLLVPLTAVSIWITVAITLHYQGTGVWGVAEDVVERYRTLRLAVDSFFGVRNPELFP